METNTFNKKIKEAYISGLKWADKPELDVLYLFELANVKKVSYEYSADSIEDPGMPIRSNKIIKWKVYQKVAEN